MELDVRVARTDDELLAAFEVRRIVFIDEQGVPDSVERDDRDATADHVVAYLDGAAVGVGRLVVDADVARVGRIAVLAPARRQGIGAAVLAQLEAVAADRGAAAVELHAQLHALAFYGRLGYAAYRDIDIHGIMHKTMRKQLAAD